MVLLWFEGRCLRNWSDADDEMSGACAKNQQSIVTFHWCIIVASYENNGAILIPLPTRTKCNDDRSTAANKGKINDNDRRG